MFVKMKIKCFSKRKLNVRISKTKIKCAILGFSQNCCISGKSREKLVKFSKNSAKIQQMLANFATFCKNQRNIESPFQGQQMAQLARTRCASGEVDWEDACPHSAGSEIPFEKRTGSKRFRENCEECVSSETCSTHSPEQSSLE